MVTETQDNLAQVEEMLRMGNNAGEPGTLVKGAVVPDSKGQISLGVTELKSAGYVWIYDAKTGDPSRINRNMLPSKLKLTRPDGSFVFSLKQLVNPVRGTFKCMLHPDDANRAYYDIQGLAVCLKSNLTSPYQVERHMQKRHKVEWETIKSEREHKEREEDRNLQRQMIQSMTGTRGIPAKATESPRNQAVEPLGVSVDAIPAKRKYKKHKHRKKEV